MVPERVVVALTLPPSRQRPSTHLTHALRFQRYRAHQLTVSFPDALHPGTAAWAGTAALPTAWDELTRHVDPVAAQPSSFQEEELRWGYASATVAAAAAACRAGFPDTLVVTVRAASAPAATVVGRLVQSAGRAPTAEGAAWSVGGYVHEATTTAATAPADVWTRTVHPNEAGRGDGRRVNGPTSWVAWALPARVLVRALVIARRVAEEPLRPVPRSAEAADLWFALVLAAARIPVRAVFGPLRERLPSPRTTAQWRLSLTPAWKKEVPPALRSALAHAAAESDAPVSAGLWARILGGRHRSTRWFPWIVVVVVVGACLGGAALWRRSSRGTTASLKSEPPRATSSNVEHSRPRGSLLLRV